MFDFRCFHPIRAELRLGINGASYPIKRLPAAYSEVLTNVLQTAGSQPAFAPWDGELSPQRLKIPPKNGALNTIRTCDPRLRRAVLYPLSYERVKLLV